MTNRASWRGGGRPRAAAVGVALLLVGAACSGDDAPGDGDGRVVRVFAAASLTDAFEEMADNFESAHPEIQVELVFDASSTLVEQVLDGAPVDVLATANETTMDEVVEADAVRDDPQVFARNSLRLVVPANNPADVSGLNDLADDSLLVGLCAVEVPCGALAEEALDAEGITPAVDTREPDVRALLTKLISGELDAGLVYSTDLRAAGEEVEVVEVSGLADHTTSYPIATVQNGTNPTAASDFVELVLGAEGQALLEAHGFERSDG